MAEWTSVQGTEVCIEGDGETIVCLHGWPDTLRLWDRTVQSLSARYRCVRFTLPGFGRPPQGKAWTLAELTERLLAIVDAVSPNRPVTLLLHDWGCVFGYELAARHPERIARIVALDIGDARSPRFVESLPLQHQWMIAFYQVWLAGCWLLGRYLNSRFADFWARKMALRMRCPTPQSDIHWYMGFPYAMTWFGLGGGLRGLADCAPRGPLLYFYGERKPFMFHTQDWLEALRARPDCQVVAMPTGHWLMLEQPEVFEARLLAWLAA